MFSEFERPIIRKHQREDISRRWLSNADHRGRKKALAADEATFKKGIPH